MVDGSRGDQRRNGPRSAGAHLIGEPLSVIVRYRLYRIIDIDVVRRGKLETFGLIINWNLKYEDDLENCLKNMDDCKFKNQLFMNP